MDILALLKNKAVRNRVWYRALSIHERVLVGLALKYVKQVRNKQLAIVLARIAVRLSIAVDGMIRVEQLGFARAYTWIKAAAAMGMSMYDDAYNSIRSMVEWFSLLEMSLSNARYYY